MVAKEVDLMRNLDLENDILTWASWDIGGGTQRGFGRKNPLTWVWYVAYRMWITMQLDMLIKLDCTLVQQRGRQIIYIHIHTHTYINTYTYCQSPVSFAQHSVLNVSTCDVSFKMRIVISKTISKYNQPTISNKTVSISLSFVLFDIYWLLRKHTFSWHVNENSLQHSVSVRSSFWPRCMKLWSMTPSFGCTSLHDMMFYRQKLR